MRRFAVCVVGFAATLAGLVATVNGYVLSGSVWGKQQVPYYINPQNLYVPSADAIAAIQSAGSNWSTQSLANVQLVNVGTTTNAVIAQDNQSTVFFRNDSNGSLAAETYWWTDGTGKIIESDIVIHEANYVWFTGTTSCTGNGLYIEDILTHEFGHFLGMYHSTVATATMYPSGGYCTEELRSLDPDDISGLQASYPPVTTSSTPPAAPSQLNAAPNSSNPASSVSLAWVDGSTNASGYNVERSPDGSSFSTVAQLGSSATSFVDSGLSSGAVYYYRVKAYNNTGSAYSNVASTQTQSAPAPAPVTQPPAVPSSPSPVNGSSNQNANSTTLSWGAAAGAQSYDVYFGTTSTPGLYQSNVTATSVKAPSMTGGTTYYWMVIAKNSAGSTAGPVWRFTTKTTGKR
jgi:Matrixin/Fibronectin type III domain